MVNQFFPDKTQYLTEMTTSAKQLQKTAKQLIELKNQGVSGREILQLKEEFEDIENIFLNSIENSLAHEDEELVERANQVDFAINAGRNTLLLTTLLAISLAVLIGIYVSRSISAPVIRLKQATKRIGEGKLDTKININSNDEIGELADAFNLMAGDLAASAALTVEKEYVDNILMSMIDTLVVINPDGKIRTINQATLELLGYQENELVGLDSTAIIASDEEVKQEEKLFHGRGFGGLIRNGFVRGLEITYINKTSERIPMVLSGSVMKDNDGNIQGIVCVAQDATERKLAETKIRQSNAQLTITNNELKQTQSQLIQSAKLASVGEMATGVAHELNQPLGIIAMSADLQLIQASKGEFFEAKHSFELILKQVERATTIINHLRTFGRESNKSVHSANDINRLVEDAFIMLNEQLRLQDIEVIRTLGDNLPRVKSNLIQIEQVLTNLVVNAKDALESTEDKQLTISTFALDNKVVTTIKDNGTGISSVDLAKIFDPFFTTKEVGKGTGLGLSISYGIIEDHGGKLLVSSVQGQGTTFRIELPAITEATL
ncbi:MAG: PAS domain S-box-containing protein [Phenylobacterium sp.]